MPWESLRKRLHGPEGLRVAGVLSGTSADGVDVGAAAARAQQKENRHSRRAMYDST